MTRRSTTSPIALRALDAAWRKQVREAKRRQNEWIAQAEAKRKRKR
jgi:hypothetical protein